jgi:hypothetical protein
MNLKFLKMEVITIESNAFAEIMGKLKSLEEKFVELKFDAENPLTEKWLDNQEVMQLLKISKRTLQTYRDENLLAFSQVGNKMYYNTKDIESFLKSNYKKTKR